jgi:hypothetical protein
MFIEVLGRVFLQGFSTGQAEKWAKMGVIGKHAKIGKSRFSL